MDKRMTLALCVVISLPVAPALAGSSWETDFEEATAAAKASNRYMLISFSGSDWCRSCIELDKEVFSKKEFKNYADQHLVCVQCDFPRHKAIKKGLNEQNKELVKKYKIGQLPTVVILGPEGDLVAKTKREEGDATSYVQHLREFIDPHRREHNVPDPKPITRSLLRVTPSRLPLQTRRPKPLARDDDREIRTWKSKRGHSVTASVVQEKGPHVILKKEDGTTIQILASKLSDEDLRYIAELKQ